MDLYKAIQSLYVEKKRLDKLIESLEALRDSGGLDHLPEKPKKRRGRKGMSAEERAAVSERMKKYWAERRTETADQSSTDEQATTPPSAATSA